MYRIDMEKQTKMRGTLKYLKEPNNDDKCEKMLNSVLKSQT